MNLLRTRITGDRPLWATVACDWGGDGPDGGGYGGGPTGGTGTGSVGRGDKGIGAGGGAVGTYGGGMGFNSYMGATIADALANLLGVKTNFNQPAAAPKITTPKVTVSPIPKVAPKVTTPKVAPAPAPAPTATPAPAPATPAPAPAPSLAYTDPAIRARINSATVAPSQPGTYSAPKPSAPAPSTKATVSNVGYADPGLRVGSQYGINRAPAAPGLPGAVNDGYAHLAAEKAANYGYGSFKGSELTGSIHDDGSLGGFFGGGDSSINSSAKSDQMKDQSRISADLSEFGPRQSFNGQFSDSIGNFAAGMPSKSFGGLPGVSVSAGGWANPSGTGTISVGTADNPSGLGKLGDLLGIGKDTSRIQGYSKTSPSDQSRIRDKESISTAISAPRESAQPSVTAPNRPQSTSQLSPTAQSALSKLDAALGYKLGITPNGAVAVKGHVKNSQHYKGNAVDVNVAGMTQAEKSAIVKAAVAAGFNGVGIYGNNADILHFDVRPEKVSWGTNYHRDSTPGWGRSALSGLGFGW